MYRKRITIVFLFLAFFTFLELGAQTRPLSIKKSEFKKQENGFKEAWQAIKHGDKYFASGVGSFREAREEYLKAYAYNPENAELNYMIGGCYLHTDNKFESIKYIEKAFKLKPNVHFDIHLLLGQAYHQILEFDKAIGEYNNFLNNVSSKNRAIYKLDVDQYIKQCQSGKLLSSEPKRMVINNMGKAINSIFDEYGSVLPPDGSVMYFTTRRKYTEKSQRSIIDDKYFENIYASDFLKGEWTRAVRLDKKILGKTNTTNIAVVGISPDKTKLYVYQGKQNNGDMFVSNLKKGSWSKLKPLKKFNSKYKDVSMCISTDGNSMYFASSSKKQGYGGTDIYVSYKNPKGKWSKPQNLGNVVNTFYDELGVSLGPNDSVLYFSSKGHNSMGGFDVFKSSLSNVGLWSKPENLGYPLNTPNDDVFYSEMPDGKTAYYSANRESGIGGMDIYKIIYLGSEKELQCNDIEDKVAGAKVPYDDIYFIPTQKLKTDTTILLRGFINDSENKKPVIAKLEIIDRELSQSIATAISDSTGNYALKIPSSKLYGIDIIAKGYLLYIDIVDLSQFTYDEVVVKNFLLDRVEVGAKVILKNIYFESGKATLKTESTDGLNNIVKLMESNPTIHVEISGHTDNIGSLKTNTKLSADRAKAVVDYLVEKGINANRLEYKGYAFSQPVAPNSSEDGRKQNRRVEFKVLSK